MRGRGGRGRGRSSNRPSLPFKITKELDLGDGATSKSKTRSSMFKVSQRKEQRKAARHKGRLHSNATRSKPPQTTGRKLEDKQENLHTAKKQVEINIIVCSIQTILRSGCK